MDKSIEFELKYNSGETEKLEQKCTKFLKYHGCPDVTIQAQIMILRELIISGEKLDGRRSAEFEMTVHLHMENDSITVEIRKPVDESTYGKLQELDKTIQWIRGCQDPLEPYMLKQDATADTSHISGSSGFALARLAHEANAIIDFYVSEDNILNLSAVRNLDADGINVG
ncbi:MAG: hypothetical protein WB819_19100 [Terriglobia bacterium]|jgi:hypothetical protein